MSASYADTGFLVTLYRQENTSARAAALMRRQAPPVRLSQLGELEFRNALHLAVFRGELAAGEAALKQRLFEQDLAQGIFAVVPIPSTALFATAAGLADRHSARLGTRSLDLVHVAAALLLDVGTFLSFDARQRAAAKSEGLKVKP